MFKFCCKKIFIDKIKYSELIFLLNDIYTQIFIEIKIFILVEFSCRITYKNLYIVESA